MKKILVTGFESFGTDTVNPTEKIVNALPEQIGELRIIKLVLPVEYRRAAREAIKAAKECQPDAILCLGLAGGRKEITPERVAINMMDARIPDNAGRQPVDQPIDPEGENAYFSTLPVKEMVKRLSEAGYPAVLSNTAGTFVCNDLLYRMLAYTQGLPAEIPCGFVHFPYCEEMERTEGAFAMKLEDEIKAAGVILQTIITTPRRPKSPREW